jgi:hypothetical protein
MKPCGGKNAKRSKKLEELRSGPYEIEKQISNVSYALRIPGKRRHNVLYTSLLEEVPIEVPLALNAPGGEEDEYEVEEICNHRRKGNRHQYLVQWKGYGEEERTWEFRKNLIGCEDLLQNYLGQIDPEGNR